MSYLSHVKNEGRVFDCMYDPSYIVSGKADTVKANRSALSTSAPIEIQPVYSLMFSDLPQEYRRNICKVQNPSPVPNAQILPFQRLRAGGLESFERFRKVECCGKDRSKFFHHLAELPTIVNVQFQDEQPADTKPGPPPPPKTKNQAIQSMYRVTSMQTLPYEPGVYPNFYDLEVNTVASFIAPNDKIGQFEVRTIDRARRRREYEACLQKLHILNDRKRQKLVLEAFEWEEWIAREEDIHNCQKLRMLIVVKMFNQRQQMWKSKEKERLARGLEMIQEKSSKRTSKIEAKYQRDLRKLEARIGKSNKYKPETIYQGLSNAGSDFQGPQKRFGVKQNRRHFYPKKTTFDHRINKLDLQIKDEELTLQCPLAKLKEWSLPKRKFDEIYKGFKSDKNLKVLTEDLRALREKKRPDVLVPDCLQLKKTKEKTAPIILKYSINQPVEFPRELRIDDMHDTETIMSIPSSTLSDTIDFERFTEETRVSEELKQEELIDKYLAQFEGNQIGWMLQFLEDELDRLKEEKRIQAFCLLAEKERNLREAAEAGLRQKENKRRQELQSIHATCNQQTKLTISDYLEKVLVEEYDLQSCAQARAHIQEIAAKIDKDARHELDKDVNSTFRKEHVSYAKNVVNEFLLPEVRRRFAHKQTHVVTEHRYETIDRMVGQVLVLHYGEPTEYEETLDVVIYVLEHLINIVITKDVVSETSSEEDEAHYEAKMAIKTILRNVSPKRRWMNSSERIAATTVDSIFSNVAKYFDKAKSWDFLQSDLLGILADIQRSFSVTSNDRTGKSIAGELENISLERILVQEETESENSSDDQLYSCKADQPSTRLSDKEKFVIKPSKKLQLTFGDLPTIESESDDSQ